MRAHSLDRFRQQGVLFVAVAGWGCWLWLAIMGWLLDNPAIGCVLLVAAAVNVLPTMAARQRRFDANTRLVAGTLAAVHPALGVFLLGGHAWQLDWHMYFFVAMAGLTVLCDWRPIVLAAVLVAAHHLVLSFVAPSWIFSGQGELGRVAVHALAVILQAAALAFVTTRLRDLMVEQGVAQAESERLARLATDRSAELQAAIERAEGASEAAKRANAREVAERQRHEQLERDNADARRRDMLALAVEFDGSVNALVGKVLGSLDKLGVAAQALGSSASRTKAATVNVAIIADQSSTGAEDLVHRLVDLSRSVNAIASSVEAQGDELSLQDMTAASIKDAARDSALAVGGIVDEMQTIAAVTDETARLSANMAGAVADLSQISRMLEEQSARFTRHLRTARLRAKQSNASPASRQRVACSGYRLARALLVPLV